jgi:hypothetical protein
MGFKKSKKPTAQAPRACPAGALAPTKAATTNPVRKTMQPQDQAPSAFQVPSPAAPACNVVVCVKPDVDKPCPSPFMVRFITDCFVRTKMPCRNVVSWFKEPLGIIATQCV